MIGSVTYKRPKDLGFRSQTWDWAPPRVPSGPPRVLKVVVVPQLVRETPRSSGKAFCPKKIVSP